MSEQRDQPFLEKRRQQFLDEYSYEYSLPEWKENVDWGATGASFPQRPKDDGVYRARRFAFSSAQQLTNLLYTGGEPFDEMLSCLTRSIDLFEEAFKLLPNAIKLQIIENQQIYEIYEPEDLYDLTKLASLTVLFNHPDLTARVNAVVEQKELFTDAVYGFIVTGKSVGDKTIDPQHQKRYQKLIDAIHAPSKEEALKAMHAYLKDWYKKHKGYLWHGSHERITEDENGREVNESYVGYWSFESAAVVYWLGLDDTELHQYIWYPKDMLEYARSQPADSSPAPALPSEVKPTPIRYTGKTLEVGDTCQHVGWYEAPYLNNRVVLFQAGQKLEGEAYTPQGKIIWYELTEVAVREHLAKLGKR